MGNDESRTPVKTAQRSHVEVVSEYAYSEVEGITVVIHNAVKRQTCEDTGEPSYYIPNRNGLLNAVATYRATLDLKLTGPEVKFLRKMLEVPAKALAEIVDVTAEHWSRIENGKTPINNSAEKLLRVLVVKKLHAPGILVDEKKIVEMKLKSVRAEPTITMHFKLGSVRSAQEMEEAYMRQAA